MTLTIDDIEAGYDREEWHGFGYLGERGHHTDTLAGRAQVDAADAAVLAEANRRGWDAEHLFRWTNSTYGRHCADWIIGNDKPDDVATTVAGYFDRLDDWDRRNPTPDAGPPAYPPR